jgi:hypothetical protein
VEVGFLPPSSASSHVFFSFLLNPTDFSEPISDIPIAVSSRRSPL